MDAAKSGQLPQVLLRGLDAMRLDHTLCDVILKTGDMEFHAHRAVLAAVSPFFRAIFSHNFNDSKEIDMKEADADSLAAVIDFIYTAKLKVDSDVVAILKLSDFLQISSLKCICAEHLKQNINTTNCQQICKVAETLELQELHSAAKKFISEANLSHPVVLVAGGRDWDGKTLRTAECLTKVGSCWRWRHAHPPKEQDMEEPSNTLAVMHASRADAAFVATHTDLYVFGGRKNTTTFLSSGERFNLQENKWYLLAPLPEPLADAAATLAQGNTIFVMGGRNSQDWSSKVWIYNIQTNSWHPGPSLPEKRIQHSAVNWHHTLYILGGKTEKEAAATATMLALECGASEWLQVSSMPRPRAQFACSSAHGCIYVIGGTDGIHTLANAERYNLMRDQWSTVANYSLPVEGSCATTFIHSEHRESVVCIGGSDGTDVTNRVEKLGVSGDQWHCLAELTTPRSHCAVAVFQRLC